MNNNNDKALLKVFGPHGTMKYSPDQERDDHGRFGSGNNGSVGTLRSSSPDQAKAQGHADKAAASAEKAQKIADKVSAKVSSSPRNEEAAAHAVAAQREAGYAKSIAAAAQGAADRSDASGARSAANFTSNSVSATQEHTTAAYAALKGST